MPDAGPITLDEVLHAAEFRRLLRRFLAHGDAGVRRARLTPQRYLLLLMIKGARDGTEQSTVTELAERLQLAQSTVTELVSRAEDAGLVARAQSQSDARVAHLRLTPAGEERLERAFTSLGTERAQLRDAYDELDV